MESLFEKWWWRYMRLEHLGCNLLSSLYGKLSWLLKKRIYRLVYNSRHLNPGTWRDLKISKEVLRFIRGEIIARYRLHWLFFPSSCCFILLHCICTTVKNTYLIFISLMVIRNCSVFFLNKCNVPWFLFPPCGCVIVVNKIS